MAAISSTKLTFIEPLFVSTLVYFVKLKLLVSIRFSEPDLLDYCSFPLLVGLFQWVCAFVFQSASVRLGLRFLAPAWLLRC
jgi:hypothetical protein